MALPPVAYGTTPSYPAVLAVLARRKLFQVAGALLMALPLCLLAWRTGWPEFLVVAALAAGATFFCMRVALEVLQMVADTLMPQ